MNIVGYIKKYGDYSFKERPFNDVDAAILATAIYANLEVVAPSINDVNTQPTLFKNIFSVDLEVVTAGKTFMKGLKKLIPAMRKSKRFGEVGIRYIYKVYNEELANQFYACTFIIPGVGNYITFRGTDVSTIGWQEDLNLCIKEVIISQLDALDYVNVVSSRVKGPLMLAGHSKGGNLVLYVALNCSQEIRDRITNFYSFDGNGLKEDDFYDSDVYQQIKNRIRYLCPKDTVVGAIMNNPKDIIIVKSNAFYVFQHNPHSWKINPKNGEFIHPKKLTKNAEARFIFFREFISSLNEKDKITIISTIVKLVGGTSTMLIDFISSFGKIFKVIKIWKELDKEGRDSVKRAVKAFSACRKKTKLIRKQRKIEEKNK